MSDRPATAVDAAPLLPGDLFARQEAARAAAREIRWGFTPHPKQTEILAAKERFLTAFCGRRFGKTMIATRWITEEAIRTQGMTWWVAPTYAASMRAWRDLLRFLPRQYRTVYKADKRIELAAGGVIEFKSADNADALRGEGLTAAVVDEAAYVQDTVWHDVLSPMFLTTRGRVLAITTPRAKYGWAWDQFQAGNKHEPDYRSWNCATSDNPYVPLEEIERMRRTMPAQSFQREVLAQAVDALNNPLTAARDCAVAPLGHLPQRLNRYVMGVDWGRSLDYTVFSVMIDTGNGTGRQVALERFTGLRYKVQMQRFRDFVAYWQPEVVLAEDNNMGNPLVELLQDEGLPLVPFHTSVQTKEPLIRQFQLGLEQHAAELLNDPVLVEECCEYEEEVETGVTTFSAPDRQHDDTVIATALSWQALNGAPGGARAGSFDGDTESYLCRDTIAPGLREAA